MNNLEANSRARKQQIQDNGMTNQLISGRFDTHQLKTNLEHWGVEVAREVINAFPSQERYTCAAGISPSGVVHFGNFRDVVTSLAIARGLRHLGKEVRLLFSWDDFDRFRKVPAGQPPELFQFLGRPLSKTASPAPGFQSYSDFFEKPFEKSVADLGIAMEWRYQTAEYLSGRYIEGIKTALNKRLAIANVLLANMSEKSIEAKKLDRDQFREEYYPLTVYSEFSGTDNTKVTNYDGNNKITYTCLDTGKASTIDLTAKPAVKLPWKIDWPMRWGAEEVNFEPGGRDHASPGGSFDSAGVISQLIFDRRPPVFVGYEFIGLKGLPGKMSGSKGGALTPGEIMEVYEPELLMWLYMRKAPHQSFQIAFDTDVYRIYDEFDRDISQAQAGSLPAAARMGIDFVLNDKVLPKKRMSFRQIAGLGQIVQWDAEKLHYISSMSGSDENRETLESRLKRAKFWLQTYYPSEMVTLQTEACREYFAALSEEQKKYVSQLVSMLSSTPNASIQDLETTVYGIPKDESLPQSENSVRQRMFFSNLYQLLLGTDTGPRLGTFLWAADRKTVLRLLTPTA